MSQQKSRHKRVAKKTAKKPSPTKACYRQGDVYLYKIDEIPKAAKKILGTTVAYGEVTGHHHTFDQGQLYEMAGSPQPLYVDLSTASVLTHQEHQNQVVEAGQYHVVIQRELDYMGAIRNVMD